MFNKPSWLKPEINEFKYWLHLIILVLVVYLLLNKFVQPMAIDLQNVALGVLFVGLADIIAHTVLQLD